jgi:TonB family protein
MTFRSSFLIAAFITLPTLLLGQNTNPVPIDTTAPEYPESLIDTGSDGVAKIQFTVNGKGVVEDAEVVEATEPEFGEAALEALKQWRFRPATVDGKPVSKKVVLPFRFTASIEDKLNAAIGRKVYQEITAKKLLARNLDERPIVVKRVRALYPPQLNGSGVDERVTVQVTIGPDGLVYNPDIIQVQQPDFLLPGLVAASQWEFEPPLKNGKPVYCSFEMTVWVYEGETPPDGGGTEGLP